MSLGDYFKKNIKPLADELDDSINHYEKKGTQLERAYKMLKRAGSHGVHNYDFSNNGMLRYGSLILELRKDGHNISVERQYLPNGRSTQVYKYYLLDEE